MDIFICVIIYYYIKFETPSNSSSLKWLAWENMVKPKSMGGLGLRALREFNLAMLAKKDWRLLNDTMSLSYRILKSKYFPNSDFLHPSIGPNANPNVTWRSIMKAQHLLREGCRKRVGNGTSIDVWKDSVPYPP